MRLNARRPPVIGVAPERVRVSFGSGLLDLALELAVEGAGQLRPAWVLKHWFFCGLLSKVYSAFRTSLVWKVKSGVLVGNAATGA